jgi:amyloid beta precursor protein binding protein 1
MQTFLANLSL